MNVRSRRKINQELHLPLGVAVVMSRRQLPNRPLIPHVHFDTIDGFMQIKSSDGSIITRSRPRQPSSGLAFLA